MRKKGPTSPAYEDADGTAHAAPPTNAIPEPTSHSGRQESTAVPAAAVASMREEHSGPRRAPAGKAAHSREGQVTLRAYVIRENGQSYDSE